MSIFDKLRRLPGDDIIEFACHKDFYGIIPEPVPAKKWIPDWFKQLGGKLQDDTKDGPGGLQSSTIKRCPPFLDAMNLGWIIPLAGDVQFTTNEDASGVDYSWKFPSTLIENHDSAQIKGHPGLPKPPMKWINKWFVKVPPGYSVLFVPPLNRPNPHFECLSGFVDCDGYWEIVNFPFMFNTPNWEGVIEAGTPLVQVIPIKRDMIMKNSITRPVTNEEWEKNDQTKLALQVHESHYRDFVWDRKKGSK